MLTVLALVSKGLQKCKTAQCAHARQAAYLKENNITFRATDTKLAENADCKPQTRCARLVTFTLPRSGSRWFVDEMKARSNGTITHAAESSSVGQLCSLWRKEAEHAEIVPCIAASKWMCGNCDQTASGYNGHQRMHKDNLLEAAQKAAHSQLKATAIETHTFQPLLNELCRGGGYALIMWRRNSLRRIISCDVHEMMRRKSHHLRHASPWSNWAHPRTKEQATSIAAFKPHIDARAVLNDIEVDERLYISIETRLMRLTASACHPSFKFLGTFEYQRLTAGEGEWVRLFDQLRLPHRLPAVASTLSIIHGNLPVLSTVANAGEVMAALNGTRHAWMLHSH